MLHKSVHKPHSQWLLLLLLPWVVLLLVLVLLVLLLMVSSSGVVVYDFVGPPGQQEPRVLLVREKKGLWNIPAGETGGRLFVHTCTHDARAQKKVLCLWPPLMLSVCLRVGHSVSLNAGSVCSKGTKGMNGPP